MPFTMRNLLLPLLALPYLALAQSSSSMTTSMSSGTTTGTSTSAFNPTTATDYLAGPTPAATNAVHYPGDYGYTYLGCYNETTWLPGGNRAVEDGSMLSNNSLTVTGCLTFCKGNSYAYCGIEYGRECWGGHYLSTLAAQMPSSNCSVGCVGNLTEFCGGFLTLTMYNLTGSGKTGAGTKEAASAVAAIVFAAGLGLAFAAF